jgi:hypothetical protein
MGKAVGSRQWAVVKKAKGRGQKAKGSPTLKLAPPLFDRHIRQLAETAVKLQRHADGGRGRRRCSSLYSIITLSNYLIITFSSGLFDVFGVFDLLPLYDPYDDPYDDPDIWDSFE